MLVLLGFVRPQDESLLRLFNLSRPCMQQTACSVQLCTGQVDGIDAVITQCSIYIAMIPVKLFSWLMPTQCLQPSQLYRLPSIIFSTCALHSHQYIQRNTLIYVLMVPQYYLKKDLLKPVSPCHPSSHSPCKPWHRSSLVCRRCHSH